MSEDEALLDTFLRMEKEGSDWKSLPELERYLALRQYDFEKETLLRYDVNLPWVQTIRQYVQKKRRGEDADAPINNGHKKKSIQCCSVLKKDLPERLLPEDWTEVIPPSVVCCGGFSVAYPVKTFCCLLGWEKRKPYKRGQGMNAVVYLLIACGIAFALDGTLKKH